MRSFAAIIPLFGLVACANLWGFDDLALAPDAALPAPVTDAHDTDSHDTDAQDIDANDESSVERDASVAADAAVDGTPRRDAGDESLDAGKADGEGGGPLREDAGSASDGGSLGEDAGDSAMTGCKAACAGGCCDSNGICQKPTTAMACGAGGNACMACAQCSVGLGPCCGATTGECGCTLLGLGCNKQ